MKYYKENIYSNYISAHTRHLYGQASLVQIESAFDLWEHYYNKFLPVNKEAHILDIGCGDGGFVYFLQKSGYTNCTGIDVSDEQIKAGKEMGIEGLQKGDLKDFLENNKETFDCIIARDVLEHFTKDEVYNICQLIYQSLNKEGRLMFQSPNGEGLQVEKIYEGDYTHDTKFTVSSSRQFLQSIGFQNIQCDSVLFPVRSIKSMIRMILWKCMVGIHKLKRAVIYGSTDGIFTPNIIVIADKTVTS